MKHVLCFDLKEFCNAIDFKRFVVDGVVHTGANNTLIQKNSLGFSEDFVAFRRTFLIMGLFFISLYFNQFFLECYLLFIIF